MPWSGRSDRVIRIAQRIGVNVDITRSRCLDCFHHGDGAEFDVAVLHHLHHRDLWQLLVGWLVAERRGL